MISTIPDRPTPEEAIRFVSTDAFRIAAAAIAGSAIVHVQDDVLRTEPAADRQDHTFVQRMPNGSVRTNNPALRIRQSSDPQRDPFAASWHNIQSRANQMITGAMAEFVANTERTLSARELSHPYPWFVSADHDQAQRLSHAVTNATRGAQATLGIGYARADVASRMAQAEMYSFLDPRAVSDTMKFVGPTATLAHLNLVVEHRELLSAAYDLCPNAVVHQLNADRLPPDSWLSQAQPADFAARLQPMFPETEHWKAFLRLPTRIIRELPTPVYDFAPISAHCARLDVTPRYTIARWYVKERIDLSEIHLPWLDYALRQGAAARPRNGIRQLAREAHAIRKHLESHSFTPPDHLRSILASHGRPTDVAPHPDHFTSEDGTFDWTSAASTAIDLGRAKLKSARAQARIAARQEAKHQADNRTLPSVTYTSHPVSNGRTAARRHTRALIQENPELIASIAQSARQSLPSLTSSDHHLTLSTPALPEAALEVSRNPDHTLSVRSGYWAGQPIHLDPQEYPDTHWTSRGIAAATIAQAAALHLPRYWAIPQAPPDAGELLRWLNAISALLPDDIQPAYIDAELTRCIRLAISSVTHRDSLTLAQSLFGEHRVTINRYNHIASAYNPFHTVSKSNPAAAAWTAHLLNEHSEPIRHPGQVISLARQTLSEAGFDLRNWKSLNRLRPNAVATTFNAPQTTSYFEGPRTPRLAEVAHRLNLIALAGAEPDSQVWTFIAPPQPAGLTATKPEATQDRLDLLLIAESARLRRYEPQNGQEHLAPQYQNCRDAFRDPARPCRANTWRGALKAARRWHIAQARNQWDDRWKTILSQNNGHYRQWPTLIAETELPNTEAPYAPVEAASNAHLQRAPHHAGHPSTTEPQSPKQFTAHPLNSDLLLLNESRQMRHCVITYSRYCIEGNTRIFSIHQNDQPIATVELDCISNTWSPVQTRGVMNQSVPPQIDHAANQIADAYNDAWRRATDQQRSRHQTGVTLIPHH